ncbi:hypothetical protein Zmor_023292 [Zophobas morio]|uniref:Retrotransposon gag domain-containing protein n=1 Tax=Zophobas morio TaxID=2755281 RepID=A0AA38M6V6_9CUCU|nr:hypothetical protein Zmor_023292 [Zophobas morio]
MPLTRRMATRDESSQFQDLMEMMRKIQEDTSQNKEELMTEMRNNLEVLKVEINIKMENLLEDNIRVQSEELVKVCEQRMAVLNERLTEEISKLDHKLITVEAEFNKKLEALRMVDTSINPLTMSTNASNKIIIKSNPYDGKASWEEYFTQFNIIADLNGWNNSEKVNVLAAMLRNSAVNVLQNLPQEDRLNYEKLTSALKLRFGDAHLAELLYGQLRNRIQSLNEDLTSYAYEVQTLAKKVFVNSPLETQELVASKQFVEGIEDIEVQKIVRLSSPRTLQDALVKALDIEAAIKATRLTKIIRTVEAEEEYEVKAANIQRLIQDSPSNVICCWGCGKKAIYVLNVKVFL